MTLTTLPAELPVVSPAVVVPPTARRLEALAVSVGLNAQLFVADDGTTVVEAWRNPAPAPGSGGGVPVSGFATRMMWRGGRSAGGMVYRGGPHGKVIGVTALTAELKAMPPSPEGRMRAR